MFLRAGLCSAAFHFSAIVFLLNVRLPKTEYVVAKFLVHPLIVEKIKEELQTDGQNNKKSQNRILPPYI